MHEWGITQDLVSEVKKQALQNNMKKVSKVEIALGKKADLTQQALETCFQALIKDDSLLKESTLEIKNTEDHKIIVNTIQGEQD
ncbi:MAG: hydrogenase maturation nickel metallochaperone HypA [Planctomycetes bacterium]|nr:hydrogenase maturation nickel metallochaperone HypA [Planctomycetota bacterium]